MLPTSPWPHVPPLPEAAGTPCILPTVPPLPVQWAPVVTLDGAVAPAASPSAAPLSGDQAFAAAAAEGLELVLSSRSGTGFKFVERHRDKYLATIQKDGKQCKLSFATPEEAALCVARFLGAQGAAEQAAVARATAARPPPMTRSEALAAAAAEGLTLLTSSSGTGFKGVTTAGKKYKASCSVPGTRDLKHLGTFECAEAAALRYARYLGRERVAAQVEDALRPQLTVEDVLALAAREGLCLVRSTNETGFKGVKKNRKTKYQAHFGDEYLGSFPTVEEAALVYARYIGAARAAEEAAAADVATGAAAARAEVVATGEPVVLPLAHDKARGSGRARGRGGRPRGGSGRGGGGRGRGGGGGGRTSAGTVLGPVVFGGSSGTVGPIGPVLDVGSSAKKRKRPTLLEKALDARLKLAYSERSAYAADGEGRERAFKKKSLKVALQYVHDHVARHMGAGFDLRKLDFVRVAREGVSKVLEADNTYRAVAIHDDRMSEAVLCFDLNYAADLTLFAMAAFGELTGPRASDFHIALRLHFEFDGQVLVWARFAGKNNQQVKRRRRAVPHARSCHCTGLAGGQGPWSPFQTCVRFREGVALPETRCGVCALKALYAAHDGALPTAAGYHAAGTQSAFRSLKGPVRQADGTMSPDYRKFSWEKGSVPMPMRDDGHPDLDECARCFAEKPLSPDQMSLMFDKWARRINERRNPDAPKLKEELWRVHGLRHGAVYNLKRLNVPSEKGAALLCMSMYMWENVYGLEDAEESGEVLLPDVVGSSASVLAAGAQQAAERRARGGASW